MKPKSEPPVFSPDNEPYHGRESVFHFDEIIISCMELNQKISAFTQVNDLNQLQKAASQIIPQGINLSLTIRELVRQGYLFGALVLQRPLIERAAVISYLFENQGQISVWEDGWAHGRRPTLKEMLSTMSGQMDERMTQIVCEGFIGERPFHILTSL